MLASEYFTIASAYSSSSFTWAERAFQLLCLTLLSDLFFDVLLWLMLFTLLQTVTVGHSSLSTPYPLHPGPVELFRQNYFHQGFPSEEGNIVLGSVIRPNTLCYLVLRWRFAQQPPTPRCLSALPQSS